MRNYALLVCVSLLLIACSTKNEQYYRTHPQALQDVLKSCPQREPSLVSCEKLADIASTMNELAYQLQVNPQRFGKKILSLQTEVATQQAALQADPKQPELIIALDKDKQQLAERLAIVRWLESPES